MTQAYGEMGVTEGDGGFPPVSSTGYLTTPTSLVGFYGPNPLSPIVKAASYALDLPLDTRGHPSVRHVSGVAVPAGTHALRLDGATLYETNDAWRTWYEVASPPSGPLRDLAGAMCVDAGCLIGAWVRVGWLRP
jgi:hypothetical protein